MRELGTRLTFRIIVASGLLALIVGAVIASLDGGTGLVGLRDRVAALEGGLDVESPRGGGTRIVAALPLPD